MPGAYRSQMAARTTRSACRRRLRRADSHGRPACRSRPQAKSNTLAQIRSGQIAASKLLPFKVRCGKHPALAPSKIMGNDDWSGKTIGAALDQAAERYGDEVAYVFANGELTYTRLKETSDLLARGFLGLGVKKGDPVAIWMAGYAEWAFVYFALARIGAIMVPDRKSVV